MNPTSTTLSQMTTGTTPVQTGTPNSAFSGTGGYVDSGGNYVSRPTTTVPAPSVGSTQPFQVPSAQPTTASSQNALGALVAPKPAVATNTSDYETNRTNAVNALLGLETNAPTKSGEESSLNSSMGVNDALKSKQDLDTQAAVTAKHYDDLITQAQTQSGGTVGGADETVRALTRQKNSDLANIAIQQAAATNDYTRLSSIVTMKVNADTEEQQNKINAMKDYISALDTDPKIKAQLTAQANAQQAQLDMRKTAYMDVLKTASQNGAGPDVLNKINQAATASNASAASIYAAAGNSIQTKIPINGTGGTYTAIDTSKITDKNQSNPSWGGLSYNALLNASDKYLSTGNMPSLGLGQSANVQAARMAIQNYAGQLADTLGMTQPQIQALYKANSSTATQIINRIGKVDTVSSALTTQFPRLADLADKVKALGITESDVQAGAAKAQAKFGSVDASNYIELLNTVRQDYASLQAAYSGARGGEYFAQTASQAIPLGYTGEQYLGLMQTLQQSAQNANAATQKTAQDLIMGTGGTGTTSTTPTLAPDVKSVLDKYGIKI